MGIAKLDTTIFWDLLFKRYASPFLLLDTMIEMCEFYSFIAGIIKLHNQETQDKYLWEMYLHSYTDETFEEFKNKRIKPEQNTMSESDFQATVKQSYDILDGFVPSK